MKRKALRLTFNLPGPAFINFDLGQIDEPLRASLICKSQSRKDEIIYYILGI